MSEVWKHVTTDDERAFLLKISDREQECDIYVTDMVNLWIDNSSITDLAERSAALNPSLEARPEKIYELFKLLLSEEKKSMIIYEKESSIDVTFSGVLSSCDIKFSMSLELTLSSRDMFYEHVTVQLLASITCLQEMQNRLYQVVEAKEEEIKEYRIIGGVLPRMLRGVVTDVLDRKKFFEETVQSVQALLTKCSLGTNVVRYMTGLKETLNTKWISSSSDTDSDDLSCPATSTEFDGSTCTDFDSFLIATESCAVPDRVVATRDISQVLDETQDSDSAADEPGKDAKKMKRQNLGL